MTYPPPLIAFPTVVGSDGEDAVDPAEAFGVSQEGSGGVYVGSGAGFGKGAEDDGVVYDILM